MWLKSGLVSTVIVGTLAWGAAAQETAPTAQDRVEMLKQSFAASKAALKQYEWVETVALSLGGEEKVRQQSRCYYGAEGKLQKSPIATEDQDEKKKKRGLRGKAIESKKAEVGASLKAAVGLLRQYAPLDPAKIEAAKAAGNVSTSLPGADGRIRVTIKSYLKPGDEVVVDVDGAKNTLQGVSIASFLEEGKEKSPVSAKVTYAALPDGTIYPGTEVLEIAAQNLKVDIENSGYKKLAP
ncbi:MAG TPA: hypothetical protein VFS09_10980 [Candidatus Eisenbacteria bacterium]|nr:hypothetical protein [Candidatus Eisenbacteria bacterium]